MAPRTNVQFKAWAQRPMTMAIRSQEEPSLALRLSSPGSTQEQPARRAERLVARAQASLLARDLAGYRALFAEADSIEDIHRRYQARKQLIEEGLSASGRAARKDVPQIYLAVARATVSGMS